MIDINADLLQWFKKFLIKRLQVVLLKDLQWENVLYSIVYNYFSVFETFYRNLNFTDISVKMS